MRDYVPTLLVVLLFTAIVVGVGAHGNDPGALVPTESLRVVPDSIDDMDAVIEKNKTRTEFLKHTHEHEHHDVNERLNRLEAMVNRQGAVIMSLLTQMGDLEGRFAQISTETRKKGE